MKKTDKRRSVNLRLHPEESEKIDRICQDHGVTATDVIRAAIAAYRPTAKGLKAAVRPVGAAAFSPEKRTEIGKKGAAGRIKALKRSKGSE